jgi:hypothetical protein
MWARFSPLLIFTLWESWRRRGKVFVTALILSVAIGWLLGWWGIVFALLFVGAFYLSVKIRWLFRVALRLRQFHKTADEPVKFFIAPEILDAADWHEWAGKVVGERCRSL